MVREYLVAIVAWISLTAITLAIMLGIVAIVIWGMPSPIIIRIAFILAGIWALAGLVNSGNLS